MHSGPEWTQAVQQFQQSFGESWSNALQSFQQLGPNNPLATAPGTHPVALTFSAEKLQALQESYVKEATALWNEGVKANPGT
ncbi:MAG: class I poly(R)-hydroxyalkanoic acid synthase, partial [Xylophilus sp.]|nr:class I poly(R)-hydroxyalkanoic acid synthase [Xylophilus sp.]